MHAFYLAFRYLWSRPLSWISMVGIWLSVTATIATVAIMSGFIDETKRTIQSTTGDVVLTPRAWSANGMRFPPPSFRTVEGLLRDVPGIQGMSPHLLRPAFAQRESDTIAVLDDKNLVLVTGLLPEREQGVTRFQEFVERVPQAPEESTGHEPSMRVDDPSRPFWIDQEALPKERRGDAALPVVLLGIGLFKDLGVSKGDVLALVTLPNENVSEKDQIAPRSTRCIVGGAVKTGHFQHDTKTVYVELGAMFAFAQSSSDASEICVRAAPGVLPDDLAQAIQEAVGLDQAPVFVATWEDRNIGLLAPVRNQRAILMVIMLFFVLVACFNVFATLTILVTDKIRDIGLLTAIGSTTLSIVKVFTICGLILSVVGGALGAVSGVVVSYRMNWLNDTIERVAGVRIFNRSIYAFDQIPITVEPWFVATVLLCTIGFAVLCAFVPAIRAGRMDPVAALRYD